MCWILLRSTGRTGGFRTRREKGDTFVTGDNAGYLVMDHISLREKTSTLMVSLSWRWTEDYSVLVDCLKIMEVYKICRGIGPPERVHVCIMAKLEM